MKKINFCLIFFLGMFLTGCSVKYDVKIVDGKISENANFKLKNNIILNSSPYYTLQQISGKYFINSDFLITQEKKEYSDDNYQYVDLKNTFDNKDYLNSYALSICYSAYNVIEVDNTIQISTSNKFLCYDTFPELSDLVITSKTNHVVIEHNADEVVNGEYKWYITKQNASNKPIKFIVSNEIEEESIIDKLASNVMTIIIVSGSILLIGCVVLIYIFIKNKKVNKI